MSATTDTITIFDTTLRDGEQSPGCSMNSAEKLEVAKALVELGVDVIEAGFPIASTVEMVKYTRDLMTSRSDITTPNLEFSPEDAARTELDFLCQVVENAIEAGATTVNIPDTVGYATPAQFKRCIEYLKANVSNIGKAVISTHCHNDLGLAVANSLAGVEAGARQVECTINGLGERAGNAALEEIVMALRTRADFYGVKTNLNTPKL